MGQCQHSNDVVKLMDISNMRAVQAPPQRYACFRLAAFVDTANIIFGSLLAFFFSLVLSHCCMGSCLSPQASCSWAGLVHLPCCGNLQSVPSRPGGSCPKRGTGPPGLSA